MCVKLLEFLSLDMDSVGCYKILVPIYLFKINQINLSPILKPFDFFCAPDFDCPNRFLNVIGISTIFKPLSIPLMLRYGKNNHPSLSKSFL